MSKRPFHLGWFVQGFRPPAWACDREFSGTSNRDWAKPGFWVDMAQAIERACFDFMLIASASYMPDNYEGSTRVGLKYGWGGPNHDPTALLPILGDHTQKLGLIATLATSEWYPFQLARYMATLDHLCDGRAGWNIVTGGSDRAAQNYGSAPAPAHDLRYDMADEFVEIVSALWNSWDKDAVVMDEKTGVYSDHTKVRTIDYAGKYYQCRGPGITMPSPQGQPVILQAGGSLRGQEFSARWSDVVVTMTNNPSKMRAFRDDVRLRAAAHGRNPDDIKVFFLCSPLVKATDAEAQAEAQRLIDYQNRNIEKILGEAGRAVEVDFSQCDPDQPVPAHLTTNSHQAMLDAMIKSGRTLREEVTGFYNPGDLIGSPETVAERMGAMMEEAGGDGLLIIKENITRQHVTEITDGLVPVLQRQGLVRSHYSGAHLRDHLMEF